MGSILDVLRIFLLFSKRLTLDKMRNRNLLVHLLKLSPVILLIVAGFLSFVSKTVSDYLTIIACIGCVIFSILNFKEIPYYLKLAFLITLLYLIGISIGTYSLMAAVQDGIRYLLPFIVLFYGLAFSNRFALLLKYLLLIILLNNCYQFICYIIYAINIDLFYNLGNSANTVKGVLRAGGLTHSFDFFGFLNLIGFYLCYQFYHKKYAYLFVVFLMLSLSFKYIILFFVLLVWLKEFKSLLLITLFSVSVVSLNQSLNTKIQDGISEKYNRFFVNYNSPRPESYRILHKHLKTKTVVFAEGVGVFGGPASTANNSQYYKKVDFDWHGRPFATTDTYYPHLFIELGLIQGLIYLFLVFGLFIIEYKYLKKIGFIVVIFLISNILNFSMNNFLFLIFSFVLILPLLHSQKKSNGAILS